MKHKGFFYTELLVILYAIFPILSVLLAMGLAPLLGCQNVNEGSAPDCPGGELIYSMFVLGWFALVTLPSGLVVLVIVGLIHVFCYLKSRRRHG